MTKSEVNRAVQYVTASTSYGRETVAEVIRTGLAELTALATTSSLHAGRETILAYVCQWTIKRTGYPEPLVWEVLGHAGRWLDESICAGSDNEETSSQENTEPLCCPTAFPSEGSVACAIWLASSSREAAARRQTPAIATRA